jgi:hypothetical protein
MPENNDLIVHKAYGLFTKPLYLTPCQAKAAGVGL